MRKLALTFAVIAGLAAAPAALAGGPAAQGPVLNYLATIPADFSGILVPALKAKLDAGAKVVILDVREPNEFANGHIKGAVNIPVRTIGKSLDKLPPKNAEVVVVCRSGMRAAYATMALSMMGWTNVKDLAFGMREWEQGNLPVVK